MEAHRQHQVQQVIAAQNAGQVRTWGMVAGASPNYPPSPSGPEFEIVHVDLCQHCIPLWMNRVKAITKASDPE